MRGGLARLGMRDLPSKERLIPRDLPDSIEPDPGQRVRGSVTILRGCVTDRLFRSETLAAGRLLAHFGYRVSFGAPGCCGALHRHAGLADSALRLSRERARNLLREPLSGATHDALTPHVIVSDSAGCHAALLEPLAEEPALHDLARRLTDTPSLLSTLELPPPAHPIEEPVAFFPPCHQSHGTHTVSATRALLEHVTKAGVVDLVGEDFCCGAAGMYVMRRPEKSHELVERALERWERSGSPRIIATGNPGCLLRWESLIGAGANVEVVHPVTLLARAFCGPEPL